MGALTQRRPPIALDFDGTIVDCQIRQCAVLEEVADRFGVAVLEVDKWWSLKREGLSGTAALVELGVPPRDAERLGSAWYDEIEQPKFLELDALLDGARPAIERLKNAGMPVRLLSARRRPSGLRSQLERLGIAALFDQVLIVDPREAAEEKSALLRRWGAECFIGDTESDARAAVAASVRFIGVSSGQRSGGFLRRHGVITLASSLAEAVSLIVPPVAYGTDFRG